VLLTGSAAAKDANHGVEHSPEKKKNEFIAHDG